MSRVVGHARSVVRIRPPGRASGHVPERGVRVRPTASRPATVGGVPCRTGGTGPISGPVATVADGVGAATGETRPNGVGADATAGNAVSFAYRRSNAPRNHPTYAGSIGIALPPNPKVWSATMRQSVAAAVGHARMPVALVSPPQPPVQVPGCGETTSPTRGSPVSVGGAVLATRPVHAPLRAVVATPPTVVDASIVVPGAVGPGAYVSDVATTAPQSGAQTRQPTGCPPTGEWLAVSDGQPSASSSCWVIRTPSALAAAGTQSRDPRATRTTARARMAGRLAWRPAARRRRRTTAPS